MVSIPNQLSLSDVLTYFGVGVLVVVLAWITLPDLSIWSQAASVSLSLGVLVFVVIYLFGFAVMALVEVLDLLTQNSEGERVRWVQWALDLACLQFLPGPKRRRDSVLELLDRFYDLYQLHVSDKTPKLRDSSLADSVAIVPVESIAAATHYSSWGPESEYVSRLRAFRTFSKSCSVCLAGFSVLGFVVTVCLGLYDFPQTVSWILTGLLAWLFVFLAESFRLDQYGAMAQRGLARLYAECKAEAKA